MLYILAICAREVTLQDPLNDHTFEEIHLFGSICKVFLLNSISTIHVVWILLINYFYYKKNLQWRNKQYMRGLIK